MERMILLNPGPVTLSERVREAMSAGDWCHREPEFALISRSINERLLDIYGVNKQRFAAVHLAGSGTAAVEAMLTTFAPKQSTTLVAANGVYGERIADMLSSMQRPMCKVAGEWLGAIDLERVEAILSADSSISHVVAVHHETTTSRLNNIVGLGALCRNYDVALLLDSVSAFGAERIDFDDWNLQAVAATANKCLHGVPGVSFVIAARGALATRDKLRGSVYFDLNRYYETQHGDGFSPFTLPVQAVLAFSAALDELDEQGGWESRRSRYLAIGQAIKAHLRDLSVETLLPETEMSCVMSAYRLAGDVSYGVLHDELKARGFIIYAGQGDLSGKAFRIAHMGDIHDSDVERLTAALTSIFGRQVRKCG